MDKMTMEIVFSELWKRIKFHNLNNNVRELVVLNNLRNDLQKLEEEVGIEDYQRAACPGCIKSYRNADSPCSYHL